MEGWRGSRSARPAEISAPLRHAQGFGYETDDKYYADRIVVFSSMRKLEEVCKSVVPIHTE